MFVPQQEPAVEFAAGARIGEYRIADRIGVGGMGAVYRATHGAHDRTVALKLMHADQLSFGSSIDRMVREAAILAAIDHPGSPRFFETGMFDERPWIAMELVDGVPLATRLAHGTMAADEVVELVEHVAAVLAAAHAIGVTHRDLKPDNIFVTPGDRYPIRLIDWGIAHEQAGARYTNLNEAIGTPTYMAPEQARGGPTDGRVDVYGLGVVAYRALTGRAPFLGNSAVEILVQHLNKPPPPLAPRCPDAPLGLVELVEHMLIKCAADRPSAAEVCRTLHRIRRHTAPDYLELEINPLEPSADPTRQLRVRHG
jgi:serine/threonine protein kinase